MVHRDKKKTTLTLSPPIFLWPTLATPLSVTKLRVGSSSGSRALPLSLRINTRRLLNPGMDNGYTQTWQCYIILSTSFSIPQVGKSETRW